MIVARCSTVIEVHDPCSLWKVQNYCALGKVEFYFPESVEFSTFPNPGKYNFFTIKTVQFCQIGKKLSFFPEFGKEGFYFPESLLLPTATANISDNRRSDSSIFFARKAYP